MRRFSLLTLGGAQAVISDSALIKRSERQDYETSAALLSAASQIRDDCANAAALARSEAYADATEAARAEFTHSLNTQLQNFAVDLERDKEARRNDIADAAFAAIKAILGEIGNAEMMQAMVAKTLSNLEKQEVLAVHVSPAIFAAIAPINGIEIIPDPAFGPYDCRVVTAEGRIIASLSVQLDTIAKRWGVAQSGPSKEDTE